MIFMMLLFCVCLAALALISVLSELNSAPLFYHKDFANLIKAFETAAIVIQ